MSRTRIAALIVAAGKGSRMGGVPKQFRMLGGKAVITSSHEAFSTHPRITTVLTVIGEGQEDALTEALGDVPFALGGATRRDSVLGGLEILAADRPDRVLIHDAARPFVPSRVIDALLDRLDTHDGAVPALTVADTLARQDGDLGETVARENLVRVQTPQAFCFEALLNAHCSWPRDEEATDDAQMVRRAGGKIAIIPGDPMLDKLTYPADFAIAEARLTGRRQRSAMGFDVHRLAVGEQLWLGGVRIEHDKGLVGHSDADVALHAITDALLGTIAAGDIGTHFPPSDPQWRGANSACFLSHAAELIAARSGRVDFIDLTVICEAPKIGPYRDSMRQRIADLLGLVPEQVSIKATTTERLGFTGRGEGIAAQAIATVSLP